MTATVADLGARVIRRLGLNAVDDMERPPIVERVPAQNIAARALLWLGVVAANEAAEPADADLALSKVHSMHEAMVAAGHASWTANTIPLAVAEDMIMLVAMQLAPSFGKTVDPKSREAIEIRIRRVAMLARAPILAEQAVMDVHTHLSAIGKARWSVFDIPDYAEGPYVELAANRLAPAFMLPPDPLSEARAMRELVVAIALPYSAEPMRPEYF